MKKVPCSYARCGHKRLRWEDEVNLTWDDPKPPTVFGVPDDHPGPWYCSVTCAVYDGAMKIRTEEPKSEAG